jgi:hypothetical protein
MAPARRSPVDDSATRTALLDAASVLMLDEGYAAVTTRRVAQQPGVNNGLVSYYFGTMDGLFIELFRWPGGVRCRGVPFQPPVLISRCGPLTSKCGTLKPDSKSRRAGTCRPKMLLNRLTLCYAYD